MAGGVIWIIEKQKVSAACKRSSSTVVYLAKCNRQFVSLQFVVDGCVECEVITVLGGMCSPLY